MHTTVLSPAPRRAVVAIHRDDEDRPIEGEPGWFFDPWGYRYFSATEAARLDVEQARAQLAELFEDLPPLPVVVPVAIGGRTPGPENVARIRKAVDEIPLGFRSKWLAAGGHVEVVPGHNARIHPKSARLGPVLGWTRLGDPLCVVAGDHPDAPLTAVHEFGHVLDSLLGHVSRSPQWLKIWQADVAAGRVPGFAGQREKPEEYWAEQFARRWSPDLWARSREAESFIEGLA
jgi:hypothetical protein